jgi:outer membrane murein-binding lipoprotein Lpp
VYDFEEELRGDDGVPMNVKTGSFGQAVLAGCIVAAASLVIHRATDSSDETKTAASIATLTVQVSNLNEQVRKLNEQPYVRRDEYLGVLGGIETRMDRMDSKIQQLDSKVDRLK